MSSAFNCVKGLHMCQGPSDVWRAFRSFKGLQICSGSSHVWRAFRCVKVLQMRQRAVREVSRDASIHLYIRPSDACIYIHIGPSDASTPRSRSIKLNLEHIFKRHLHTLYERRPMYTNREVWRPFRCVNALFEIYQGPRRGPSEWGRHTDVWRPRAGPFRTGPSHRCV